MTCNLYQFAFRANRSTEDAISSAPLSALTNLENNSTYIRMQNVFQEHLNTIRILDFLIIKPQTVQISNHPSFWTLDPKCTHFLTAASSMIMHGVTKKKVSNWLYEHDNEFSVLPARLTDLNIIKHLVGVVEQEVCSKPAKIECCNHVDMNLKWMFPTSGGIHAMKKSVWRTMEDLPSIIWCYLISNKTLINVDMCFGGWSTEF